MQQNQNNPPQTAPTLRIAGVEVASAEEEELRREIESLRQEVRHLRKRDEHVRFQMNQLDEELRLAARLQRDFMPHKLPSLGPISFESLWRPAGYVSGDLYDITRIDEDHMGFYMTDAVGHGVPAALLTMFVKHSMQMKEIEQSSYRLLTPSESLVRLNDSLVNQDLSSATFASSLCGIINVRTLELVISSAGHPAPIILRKGKAPEIIAAEGGLLGIFAEQTFDDVRVQLEPGDRLLIYTDGVEVIFPGDAEQFDSERWLVELAARAGMPAGKMLEEFAALADHQEGSLAPKDDLTMVVMTVGR